MLQHVVAAPATVATSAAVSAPGSVVHVAVTLSALRHRPLLLQPLQPLQPVATVARSTVDMTDAVANAPAMPRPAGHIKAATFAAAAMPAPNPPDSRALCELTEGVDHVADANSDLRIPIETSLAMAELVEEVSVHRQ